MPAVHGRQPHGEPGLRAAQFERTIRRVHEHGIGVVPGIVLGYDGDVRATGPHWRRCMTTNVEHTFHDLPELRNRAQVFRDRAHAGDVLAGMLPGCRGSGALVLGIPAGGVPVAAAVAATLGLELDAAVVSKILLPWTTEAGYGAVAFDGSTWIDRRAAVRFGLTDAEVLEGTEKARAKVVRRVAMLRGGRPLDVVGRNVILVDDGIAAGSTLRAAIAALRGQNVARLVVAVPTGHRRSLGDLVDDVDALYCANVRHGFSFAVADAYQAWRDVTEAEVVEALRNAPAPVAADRSGDAR